MGDRQLPLLQMVRNGVLCKTVEVNIGTDKLMVVCK